jgi:SAM-dependent methyltransferase
MWKRFVQQLRCPVSGEALTLVPFEETDVQFTDDMHAACQQAGYSSLDCEFRRRVDSGVLLAPSAGLLYPIARGVPLMLPYATSLHEHFAHDWSSRLAALGPRYRFPSCCPRKGESAVMRSFSREWEGYRYDGVIWDVSYEDNERRLLTELGLQHQAPNGPQSLLEVGCGIGLTTDQARRHLKGDAVGVDLSLAVVGAAEHFQNHPLLHFVQASAFYLPFEREAFDVLYSRGVLHHTYSTREALLAVAKYCKPGGRFYLWVYGPGSTNDTAFRRVAYAAEAALRPILSRAPGPLSTAMLAPIALGYVGYNRLRQRWDGTVQTFTFERALHSARDRFTPRYAHRQDASQVSAWFREAGFESIEVIDWKDIPTADQDDYRRNTGVRGARPQVGSVHAQMSN